MPESQAIPDPDRPGLRRAGPRASAPYGNERVEFQNCTATDLVNGIPDGLGIRTAGFDLVDLSGLDDLQQACEQVRQAGSIGDAAASTIRAGLEGAVLRTAQGESVRVLYLADEGFIMRTAGPNGLSLVGPRSEGMNGHGGATSVHIDQDVYGTPLTQLMDGRAPSLFVHDSPDGRCDDASMFLMNMWIPLQQVVQPLTLADGRSIDRRRHQLRYGLPTGSFLDRDDEMAINDIWTMLHDQGQEWYFNSEMDHRSAWIFNTLSVAHGAGTLDGEDVAERCYLALEAAEAAAGRSDADGLVRALEPARGAAAPPTAPPALRGAIDAMAASVEDGLSDPAGVCGPRAGDWSAASRAARRPMVRMSLELRLVVEEVRASEPSPTLGSELERMRADERY